MARVIWGKGGMLGFSGAAGNAVFKFRKSDGATFLTQRREPSKREPTPDEEAQLTKFGNAARQSRYVLKIPEYRAFYEGLIRGTSTSLSGAVIRDGCHAPVVQHIDAGGYTGAVGEVISILATDDTGVVNVEVRLSVGRDTFEQGKAVPDAHGRWVYTAQTMAPVGATVCIAVRAYDRPQGCGMASVEGIVIRRDGPGAMS